MKPGCHITEHLASKVVKHPRGKGQTKENKHMDKRAKNQLDLDRRTCLGCGREFLSEGIHNRICVKCKESPRDKSQ